MVQHCCCCHQLFTISWPPLSAHARCGAADAFQAKRRGWEWAAAESLQQVEERWAPPQPQVRVKRIKQVFLHDFRDFRAVLFGDDTHWQAPESWVCAGAGWRAVSRFKLKRRGYLVRSDGICLAAFYQSVSACMWLLLFKTSRYPVESAPKSVFYSPVISFFIQDKSCHSTFSHIKCNRNNWHSFISAFLLSKRTGWLLLLLFL